MIILIFGNHGRCRTVGNNGNLGYHCLLDGRIANAECGLQMTLQTYLWAIAFPLGMVLGLSK